MKKHKNNIACPRCEKTGTWTTENAFRPFCSERCKMIDLGNWADETHRVPGELVDPDDLPESKE